MHLYVMAKGIKPHLEKWQNDLLAQYVKVYQKGIPIKGAVVQLAVRPVQLFEIGFPKEELDNVMNMIGTGDYITKRYPRLHKMAKYFRKFFGLKQVPLPKNPYAVFQPTNSQKAVAIVPIGIKEDIVNKEGFEQI